MFYLTTYSTHFIYGYMASDMVKDHIGYSYWLTARVLLYAPSHRQDNTYHSLYYTSRGALAGMRNIDPTTHCTMSKVQLQRLHHEPVLPEICTEEMFCRGRNCSWSERNVLFNDALNTFYLRLYGVRHMVKDHSDSEKGNPLPPHRLLLSINSKGSFICTSTDRITHTTAFVTPVVEHWLEREIAQWVHPMKDRSDDPLHHERMLYLWATSRSTAEAINFKIDINGKGWQTSD